MQSIERQQKRKEYIYKEFKTEKNGQAVKYISIRRECIIEGKNRKGFDSSQCLNQDI